MHKKSFVKKMKILSASEGAGEKKFLWVRMSETQHYTVNACVVFEPLLIHLINL